MTNEVHQRDLLITGAGPAGLYAAYYAGFRGMSVALVASALAMCSTASPTPARGSDTLWVH